MDADAQVALADFLLAAGDYSAAARYYSRALFARPGDAGITASLRRVTDLLSRRGNPSVRVGT
jgi:hypothetical protein